MPDADAGMRYFRSMSAFTLALALALSPQLPGEALQEKYGARLTPEAEVYQMVAPSVVRVELWGRLGVEAKVGGRSFDTSSYFKMATGSGVVYSEDGLVLTNAHVVKPTSDAINPEDLRVRVVFAPDFAQVADEIEYDATFVSEDPTLDLALLQIESSRLFKAAPFGKSSDLLIGEKVIALGAPFGESLSLSSGMLSGLNRQVTMKLAEDEYQTFRGLIQTDAAVNVGNSGGPLLNVYGLLIGINIGLRDNAEGISYAIPVDQVVKSLNQQLMRGAYWAGFTVEAQDQTDFPIVVSVHPRGPAAAAGVQIGDRVLAIDGQAAPRYTNYLRLMRQKDASSDLALSLRRNGQSTQVEVGLMDSSARDSFGLFGVDLTQRSITYTGPNGEDAKDTCLEIVEVFEDSPADRLGLEAGDLILAVGVAATKAMPDGWARVRSVPEMVSLARGPTFRHHEDNIWILRGPESFYGRLAIDDPDVFRTPIVE